MREFPTVCDLEKELVRWLEEAKKRGEKDLDVVSGELHDSLLPPPYPRSSGGHPNHRVKSACDVMRDRLKKQSENDEMIIYKPPKGNGKTLKIKFKTSI